MHKISENWYASGESVKPAIVFLHGFMGDPMEWNPIIQYLNTEFFCLMAKLPAQSNVDTTIENYSASLYKSLPLKTDFHLVGYSLGARIAMHWLEKTPQVIQSLVFEGGHPGLTTEEEKKRRIKTDEYWCNRFTHEPIEEVLFDWYKQPVFSALDANSAHQKLKTLKNASNNFAHLLIQCSLGRQKNLWPMLSKTTIPSLYLSGELDKKYSEIGQRLQKENSRITHHIFPDSGHNCHLAQPKAFLEIVTNHIQQVNSIL